jgi:hypothetical protein
MWGAEMGVNEHGLAIGNEAVFTRVPVPKTGHLGMDFQRVALTSCRTADDALEQLIELTEGLTQGGRMGHLHRSFRYHSSFLIADATTAWVFETAGQYWAAKRVHGVATISNALTIEDDFDRIHADAYAVARDLRWVKGAGDFRFARAFSDPVRSVAAGASVRRACTRRSLAGVREPRVHDFARALADHGDTQPTSGWRGEAPCAHASWPITRTAQQTTSSIIARLDASGPTVWATGTSSPCLSVFKPAPFDSSCCRRDPSPMYASTQERFGGPTSGCTAPVLRTTTLAASRLPKTGNAFRTIASSRAPTRSSPGVIIAFASTTGSNAHSR